jgi:cell wall assembly regulator SMI1
MIASWAHEQDDESINSSSESPILKRCYLPHPRWIPIGSSGTSVSSAIDLVPTPHGIHGQLLCLDFEGGPPSMMATGMKPSIESLLEHLDSGQVRWNGWNFQTADGQDMF